MLKKNRFSIMSNNRTILMEKLKESLSSVLPITGIVFLLCFTIVPVPNGLLMAFVMGAIMLILGMGLFTLGTDMAMTPMGEYVGSDITKSKRLWLIILVSFLVGSIVTISEPDLQVLAEQVPNIPNMVLILFVAVGVGLFLVLSVLRIFFRIPLAYLLIALYLGVFVLAFCVPENYIAVAFDSGGVTTGPMTVPFIMALGVGIAAIRSDRNAESDSFGLVALCSVGPILAVLILGMLYKPEGSTYTPYVLPDVENSRELWQLFRHGFPEYMKEVSISLLPIVLFFAVFQIFSTRLHKRQLVKIGMGLLYTYLGLVLFLTGVNIGFMPVGNYIGQLIGELDYNWIIIPIGMVIGYFIVAAEPAVHVLNKQVFEMTSGAIPKKAMSTSLSIGVAVSVGLAMLRIIANVPIMYFLIPGYLIAGILTFIAPPIFTAIAFDSGGVASGPMTATFLLPLAIGVCTASGGDVVKDAFGVVAMVAMTPLIAIQILGVFYKIKSKRREEAEAKIKTETPVTFDNDIIQ